jgi:hypothetical protein
MVQAAKAGGVDANANHKLAEVLRVAKAAEVPKDIIERNLKKASDKSQADYQEVRSLDGPPGLSCPPDEMTIQADWVSSRTSPNRQGKCRSGSEVAESPAFASLRL